MATKTFMSFSNMAAFHGCAKKISFNDLSSILSKFPMCVDKNVVIGLNEADDIVAYKINDTDAIVQSLDFMPPITNDPYIFGKIVAANALGDIYAKGCKPLFALNILSYPLKSSSMSDLEKILLGGADKSNEAGVCVIGGHSVDGDEPYYGMSVTGIAKVDNIVSNSTARPGDMLFLTKPIGTGAILNGVKYSLLPSGAIDEAIASMCELNKSASEAMMEVGINACTDVTGFGLLGHLYEMIKASNVGACINFFDIPFLENLFSMDETDALPIASKHTLQHISCSTEWTGSYSDYEKRVLADPQTSGGLLISVSAKNAPRLVEVFKQKNLFIACLGKITEGATTINIVK